MAHCIANSPATLAHASHFRHLSAAPALRRRWLAL